MDRANDMAIASPRVTFCGCTFIGVCVVIRTVYHGYWGRRPLGPGAWGAPSPKILRLAELVHPRVNDRPSWLCFWL